MDNYQRYNSIVIAGPTASGKTALAVQVARLLKAEIISADSRQIYRGMDIGTGKDLAEYIDGGISVPFHLIDVADPAQHYSLYNYIHDFYPAFQSVLERKMLPIVCGGTGLYIEAVLHKYEVSEVVPDEELRTQLMKQDKEQLLHELALFPEHLKRCDISSKKRIVRALEIAQKGGAASVSPGLGIDIFPLVIVISPSVETLKTRIEKRLLQRIEGGMITEVSSLLTAGIPIQRMLMFGMEYRYITLYLSGELSFDQMLEQLKYEIFRLAKRQRTWFRGMQRRGIKLYTFSELSATDVVKLYSEQ